MIKPSCNVNENPRCKKIKENRSLSRGGTLSQEEEERSLRRRKTVVLAGRNTVLGGESAVLAVEERCLSRGKAQFQQGRNAILAGEKRRFSRGGTQSQQEEDRSFRTGGTQSLQEEECSLRRGALTQGCAVFQEARGRLTFSSNQHAAPEHKFRVFEPTGCSDVLGNRTFTFCQICDE